VNSSFPFILNLTGFENCVINLVFHISETQSYTSLDFVSKLVAGNQGQWSQLWIIGTTSRTEETVTEISLTEPHFFREMCSINFVLNLNHCTVLRLLQVFGSRLYNTKNILFFVYGKQSPCNIDDGNAKNPEVHFVAWNPIPIDIFTLYLTLDNSDVEGAKYICLSCKEPQYRSFMLDVAYINLDEIKRIANHVKIQSARPIVAVLSHTSTRTKTPVSVHACKFLYRRRYSTRSYKIGCDAPLIFVENTAAKLNFRYVP